MQFHFKKKKKIPTKLFLELDSLHLIFIRNRKIHKKSQHFLNKNDDGELALTDSSRNTDRSVDHNKVYSIMDIIFFTK